MDRFFSLFGKIVLVLLLAGGLIASGVYLDRAFIHPSSFQSNVITPTPTIVSALGNDVTPTTTLSQATHFAVSAGGIAPFKAYTLSGVQGWTLSKDQAGAMDKITLSQGDYQLIVTQAAMGGAGCSFPGQSPSEMSTQLTDPVDIPLLSGASLRRGTAQSSNPLKANFTVCQKSSDGSYGTLTQFGAINYITPLNPDSRILSQMDGMVGSLQVQ